MAFNIHYFLLAETSSAATVAPSSVLENLSKLPVEPECQNSPLLQNTDLSGSDQPNQHCVNSTGKGVCFHEKSLW